MGGSWERLIRSIKIILREMLKTKFSTERVLRIFLFECENILNSSLLTHISADAADMEALTSNRFLMSCTTTTELDLNLISSWRAA